MADALVVIQRFTLGGHGGTGKLCMYLHGQISATVYNC